MKDDFNVAIKEVKLIEKDFRQKIAMLEQENQVNLWSGQMQQTELFKNLQRKVGSFDSEITALYKNINELKALQSANAGLTSLRL